MKQNKLDAKKAPKRAKKRQKAVISPAVPDHKKAFEQLLGDAVLGIEKKEKK